VARCTTSPDHVRSRERELRALELRREGRRLADIAADLGVSIPSASRIVKRALEKLTTEVQEEAETLRALETARLEQVLSGMLPLATKGDPKAAAQVINASARLAKLWGLDAPTKIAATDEHGRGVDLASILAEARSIIANATPEELAQVASLAGRGAAKGGSEA